MSYGAISADDGIGIDDQALKVVDIESRSDIAIAGDIHPKKDLHDQFVREEIQKLQGIEKHAPFGFKIEPSTKPVNYEGIKTLL